MFLFIITPFYVYLQCEYQNDSHFHKDVIVIRQLCGSNVVYFVCKLLNQHYTIVCVSSNVSVLALGKREQIYKLTKRRTATRCELVDLLLLF